MNPQPEKSDARILGEIKRLRHLLERRKLTRTEAALTAAQQEIAALRAQLRAQTAVPITMPPAPSETDD